MIEIEQLMKLLDTYDKIVRRHKTQRVVRYALEGYLKIFLLIIEQFSGGGELEVEVFSKETEITVLIQLFNRLKDFYYCSELMLCEELKKLKEKREQDNG